MEYAVVRWADDSHSLEPTERLREDMDNRVYQQLRSMAYKDDDTPEVINAKFLRQEAYVRNLPNADAVNARRSARNHASSRALAAAIARSATASVSVASTATAAAAVASSAPTLEKVEELPVLLRCSRCARVSPGNPQPCFICWHCVVDCAGLSDKVQQHGRPRAALVRVAISTGDAVMRREVEADSDVVLDADDVHSAVDIVVVEHHSAGMSSQQHIDRVAGAINGRTGLPALVLVLSCWTDAAGQTAALQQLALLFPSVIFVTFRDPLLVKIECFRVAYPFLRDTVVFTEAAHLVFLASLCCWSNSLLS